MTEISREEKDQLRELRYWLAKYAPSHCSQAWLDLLPKLTDVTLAESALEQPTSWITPDDRQAILERNTKLAPDLRDPDDTWSRDHPAELARPIQSAEVECKPSPIGKHSWQEDIVEGGYFCLNCGASNVEEDTTPPEGELSEAQLGVLIATLEQGLSERPVMTRKNTPCNLSAEIVLRGFRMALAAHTYKERCDELERKLETPQPHGNWGQLMSLQDLKQFHDDVWTADDYDYVYSSKGRLTRVYETAVAYHTRGERITVLEAQVSEFEAKWNELGERTSSEIEMLGMEAAQLQHQRDNLQAQLTEAHEALSLCVAEMRGSESQQTFDAAMTAALTALDQVKGVE